MTRQQTTALDYLRTRRASYAGNRWVALGMMATQLDTSREGAARTMASLVRHGLAERDRAGGVTFYRAR